MCLACLQCPDDARAYFDRKIKFLKEQMEKVQPMLQEKYKLKQGKLIVFLYEWFPDIVSRISVYLISLLLSKQPLSLSSDNSSTINSHVEHLHVHT